MEKFTVHTGLVIPPGHENVDTDAIIPKQFLKSIEGYRITIDLTAQTVRLPDGTGYAFDISRFRKHCLLNGLDEIDLTLQHDGKIRQFEAERQHRQPWLDHCPARQAQ